MKKEQFKKENDAIRKAYRASRDNVAAHKSDSSERCHQSMFTKSSSDCFSCTYCDDCESCTHCTHCSNCVNVSNSSYCRDSQNLSGCSYVVQSRDCHDCVFCIGCTGLIGKEFHILNEPYPRDVYFKKLAELEKSLGVKLK